MIVEDAVSFVLATDIDDYKPDTGLLVGGCVVWGEGERSTPRRHHIIRGGREQGAEPGWKKKTQHLIRQPGEVGDIEIRE